MTSTAVIIGIVLLATFQACTAQLNFTRVNPAAAFSTRSELQIAYARNATINTGSGVVTWNTPTLFVTGERADSESFTRANDVWASSDLINWSIISGLGQNNAAAPAPYNGTSYPSSNGAAMAYSARSNIWVRISGQNSSTTDFTNVYATRDFQTWTLQANTTMFPPRIFAQAIFDSQDRLFLVGGNRNLLQGDYGDVYMSTNYGVSWTAQAYGTAFYARNSFALGTFKATLLPGQPDILTMSSGWNGVTATFNDVR
jgi:hypothetical protein